MKRRYKYIIVSVVIICITVIISRTIIKDGKLKFYFNKIKISNIECTIDKDGDGINDMDDILAGAKNQIGEAKYIDKYYAGGYPPDNEGVCTDVIWRALKDAGYNLKDMVDKDINLNIETYPRVEGNPDPNIDFRRVKNLIVFFNKYADTLTTEIIPGDVENLKEWQRGDIVIFSDPAEHIAIISDRRDINGVPYIIHNSGPKTGENNSLIKWHEKYSPITYHFRFPRK